MKTTFLFPKAWALLKITQSLNSVSAWSSVNLASRLYKTLKHFEFPSVPCSASHDISAKCALTANGFSSNCIHRRCAEIESIEIESNEAQQELRRVKEILRTHHASEDELAKHSVLLRQFGSVRKAMLLAKISENVSGLLPLLALSEEMLSRAAKKMKADSKLMKNHPNRISYLCHHLSLNVEDLANLFIKHAPLLTMDFSRLDTKMKILKNGKISAEHIVKDTWIFNYNEKLLDERVSAALNAGLSLKPWLIRCPKKHFLKILSRWQETQTILKGKNQIAYLAKRLECTEDYVHYLSQKNSQLPTVNVVKLEKILDFLYDKGYSPEEVRLFPKIFCYSVETLEKRFEKFLSTKGMKPTVPQLSRHIE